jgi:hypothetical protein
MSFPLIGEYGATHSLGSTDAQATLQRDRNFGAITLKCPVSATAFLVINHGFVRGEVARRCRSASPREIGQGTNGRMRIL